MNRENRKAATVSDPQGNVFYIVQIRHLEKALGSLGNVHETRLRRTSHLEVMLPHGPRGFGLKSYDGVRTLFAKLRRGFDLPSAFSQALLADKRMDTDGGEDVATIIDRLANAYDPAVDGLDDPQILYHSKRKKRASGPKKKRSPEYKQPETPPLVSRQKSVVNSTPLPGELTAKERRAIWRPPNSPFRW